MRAPNLDINIFKERREKLAQLMPNSALILFAHPEYSRNADVPHPYRPSSNFVYLTGFEEPASIFLFRPGKTPESIIFVRNKDATRETWDGFRYGPQKAAELFGFDAAYSIDQFKELVPKLLLDVDKLYYQLFFDAKRDELINEVLSTTKSLTGRSGKGLLPIEDSFQLIGELRIYKSEFESQQMRRAAEISKNAHIAVMKAIAPGVNERALHGTFIKSIMEQGAPREAYGGIFASGNNATTLHYVFNDQECRDGELFLVDDGAEVNYYASDVTRTYPVNGKFSPPQRRLYQKVLDAQKKLIHLVKPGFNLRSLQDEGISMMTDIMLEEGLLKGNKENLIANKEYIKFYPHGVGHLLGMDVHDVGLYETNGEPNSFVPGICLTVEPGIYIPEQTENIPNELKGIGIRIEDNLIVTVGGNENITAEIPKEIDELEAIIGSR